MGLFLGIFAALAPASCREEGPAVRSEPKGFVGFVGVGGDDPLWAVLRASALRLHKELGLSTLPLRTAAPPRSSVNAQRHLLQRLHREGMVAACVQVTEPEALVTTLDSLVTQGVQIVTMMRPVVSKVPYVHCGPDDEATGAAVADTLNEALHGRGTVAVLHADSVRRASVTRHKAFLERMASFPSLHIILEFDCNADPQRARSIIAQTMRRYARLGGWAVMDNWPLRDRDRDEPLVPRTCRMVAVDPIPPVWSGFDDGSVFAMIAWEYERIAQRALTSCVTATMGAASMPISFSAPVRTVWASNVEAFKADWQRSTQGPPSADR